MPYQRAPTMMYLVEGPMWVPMKMDQPQGFTLGPIQMVQEAKLTLKKIRLVITGILLTVKSANKVDCL